MLQSGLCNYSHTYLVAKGTITVADPNDKNYETKLPFKNNAPFICCITKINNILIENAGDLDIIMPMYNLVEHSKKSFKYIRKFTELL